MKIQELALRLWRAIGRNSGVYIAVFEPSEPVDMGVETLLRELLEREVPVWACDLNNGRDPRQRMNEIFQQAREKDFGSVLMVWSMEHQDENDLRDFLRWLNVNRERWSRIVGPAQFNTPIVFAVNTVTYQKYIGHHANDLWDCAHPYIID